MKTILVATDYSRAASNALIYAANLAAVLDAKLLLFNAFKISEHALNGLASSLTIDHMAKQKRDELAELVEQTALKFHLEVEGQSQMGEPEELLVDYLKGHAVELVVVGMETDVLAYELFGNTTTALIKKFDIPLMVVPNESRYESISRILFAYDPKFASNDNDFTLMREITNQFNAKLEVFHVNTNTSEHVTMSSVESVLEDVSFIYNEVNSRNVISSITEEIQRFGANLLVMIPHRTTFFESLMTGSTTRKFALKSKVPLLVMPNRVS